MIKNPLINWEEYIFRIRGFSKFQLTYDSISIPNKEYKFQRESVEINEF